MRRRVRKPWLPLLVVLALFVWQCAIDSFLLLFRLLNLWHISATLVIASCAMAIAVIGAYLDDEDDYL